MMDDDRKKRKELLTTPERYANVHTKAEDAKRRLDGLCLHDPLVRAVSDMVFAGSLRDRSFVKEDEYYAILALELSKQNSQLMDQILDVHATRCATPIIFKGEGIE